LEESGGAAAIALIG